MTQDAVIRTYQFLAGFAQSAGLIYFMAVFMGAALYALWPANRDKFDAAARIPLQED
ncbi:MAG: cbb3-type cytochrome c oxidase subunit 3 [Beijerinckiaceae bacterium]